MKLRPVKVTAHLASPLALSPEGFPPHLDALCELIRSRKMLAIAESSGGRHPYKPRGQTVEKPGLIPIPIERRIVAGLPIPLCSFGIVEQTPERAEHYSRQFPFERASQLAPDQRGVVRTSFGEAKSYRLPLRVADSQRVVWFAVLREGPTKLRHLLKRVHALGKKVSQGYGRVASWDVEPIDDDWSWFAPSDSGPVLMRALPVEAVPDGTLGARRTFCGVVGPYWQQNLWTEAWEPC